MRAAGLRDSRHCQHLAHCQSAAVVEEHNQSDAEIVVEGLNGASAAVTVTVVRDGVDALAYLHQQLAVSPDELPDLILLDLNLPRQGGLETLAALRDDDRLRRIPAIVLTTSSSYVKHQLQLRPRRGRRAQQADASV